MIRELNRLPRVTLSLAGSQKRHFRELVKIRRPALITLFCFVFSLLGTFRNFGFDLNGSDGVRNLYPYVADGWGIWYWFAKCGLEFNTYYFIINLVFTAWIFALVFPKERTYAKTVSFTLLLYIVFWFLFGQARYGMAAVLLGLATAIGSGLWLLVLGALAFLIHRGAAGGVLLLGAWLLLRHRKYGLAITLVLSAAISLFMLYESNTILLLSDYANYENLEKLPAALTPVKYYYLTAVLLLWKCFNWKAADSLLILILIFLPFSYFIVFAGRSYEMFAVIFLTALLTTKMPIPIRACLLAMFVVDVGVLFFKSGFFV